jgi:hypothetical protein
VSNFSQAKLEEILQTAEIVPAVNQVNELFPQYINACWCVTFLAWTSCVQPPARTCVILEFERDYSSGLFTTRLFKFTTFGRRCYCPNCDKALTATCGYFARLSSYVYHLLLLIAIIIEYIFYFSRQGNCRASQICHARPDYVQSYRGTRCRGQVKDWRHWPSNTRRLGCKW